MIFAEYHNDWVQLLDQWGFGIFVLLAIVVVTHFIKNV